MIPTEENYVDWILLGMKEYFRRINYRVLTFSIGQVKERQCPIDRVLAAGNKLIGLQFKRPISEKAPFHFKPTAHQHQMISQSRWIFYCLPDFVDFRFQDVALYHCRFVPGSETSTKAFDNERYFRWGALADAMIACYEGLEIGGDLSIERLIADIVGNPHDTYLTLNKRQEEAYLIRDIGVSTKMESRPA